MVPHHDLAQFTTSPRVSHARIWGSGIGAKPWQGPHEKAVTEPTGPPRVAVATEHEKALGRRERARADVTHRLGKVGELCPGVTDWIVDFDAVLIVVVLVLQELAAGPRINVDFKQVEEGGITRKKNQKKSKLKAGGQLVSVAAQPAPKTELKYPAT